VGELQAAGLVGGLITQNVDGLHQAAGARNVVDLHGRIDQVVCLSCGEQSPRAALQRELARLNPEWTALPARIAPDGDADPGELDTSGFRVPDCACGGMLKPDVVFFGENVPRPRVESAMAALERATSLLVVGSSLMVFSGYRFVRAAERFGLPVAIVNRGHTRADGVAHVKLDGDAASALDDVVRRLQ
jgi:NAD-dependent SIR2 family protein deacetylase